MGKINVLSFEIANLIAAGEVVERPSSVLKELMENSIDAGATEITAEIKRGGVALIRVTDNGCGIDKEDLPVSLKRHATSKIKEKDDLNSIMTLGFRGEALAAISSVSEVTIITKTKEADTGYMLSSEGGTVIDISEVGASDGTTVVVENLFFNVPARRKFLKKDSTEAMNVAALVEKIALSRPDISIQLLIDGEERFKTPGDSVLINTIRSIYGREFAGKLIKAEGISDGIKVSGYIGRSDNVRKNRNLENVFINGRYVKSLTAQAAIEKAFTSYIATEHFPACVLFIEMNPGFVDVNVHPAKLEVKFSDERKIFEAVYYTVKNALEQSEYRPEMSLGAKRGDYNPANAFVPIGQDTKGEQITMSGVAEKRVDSLIAAAYKSEGKYSPTQSLHTPDDSRAKIYDVERASYVNSIPKERSYGETVEKRTSYGTESARKTYSASYGELSPRESVDLLAKYTAAVPKQSESVENENTLSLTAEENSILYKYVGEAFDCYVIIEYEGALLIIDKHAAHERIIFEDLNRGRKRDGFVSSQTLMLPVTVILTPDELSSLSEYEGDFKNLGFEFSINDSSADITAIPTSVAIKDAEGLFVEMLDGIITGSGTPENTEDLRREKALHTIACKAAIKGGRVYDRAVIDWLIKKVLSLPDITVCPHGRPIAYKLKKSELDRQFDRIK
ncbi:MAG: DNA mismatch repair endonuclease MutL [Ruminococcaceae bacterium]|nr:DNA mismatch repair endonuclease MutL [Oscillospiraceae bacterium]